MKERQLDERTRVALEKRQTYNHAGAFLCGVGTELAFEYDEAVHNPNFIISWILVGNGTYEEDGVRYRLTDGCVCMRRPGKSYTMQVQKKGGTRLFLTIPADIYPALVRLIPELADCPPVWECPYEKTLCEQFCALYDRFSQVTFWELYEILPDICRYLLRITGIQKARDSRPLDMARRMLDENQTLSLREIAERCGMNYNTFRKQITELLGEAPGAYRIKRRIERSCWMLQNGMSVGAVAGNLGYADAYTFTHQFTAVMGLSPSRYRRQFLQGEGNENAT